MSIVHCCLDVRGALKSFNKRQLAGLFKRPDGTRLTADEAKDHLFDQLAAGREVLPFGDCDNFDYKKGCQGHPEKSDG